ncbi:MAG: hypothetical protein QM730_12205 [Anaerolineales bacterium]
MLIDDLPIPASRKLKLSGVFSRLISTFDLKSVKPYDPRFLADWPAEVYDVPLSEASLDARELTYEKYIRELPNKIFDMQIVHVSSANLFIESFKLVLLPVWMTELRFGRREYLVLINGQNGGVASDLPEKKKEKSGGLLEWLGDLLDE